MAKAYKKIDPVVSPLVTLKFPKCLEPDMSKFSTEKCPQGIFKAPGLFRKGDPAWDKLAAQLQAIYDEGVAEVKAEQKTNKKVKLYPQTHPWFKVDTDKEGNETGFLFIDPKLPAMTKANPEKNKPARAQKPIVVDAMRKNVATSTQIWGGTTAKISFIPSFFNTAVAGSGVGLRLVGVQIINLVSGGGHTAASAGFGEEDGYTADDSAEAAPSAPATPAAKKDGEDEEDDIPF